MNTNFSNKSTLITYYYGISIQKPIICIIQYDQPILVANQSGIP